MQTPKEYACPQLVDRGSVVSTTRGDLGNTDEIRSPANPTVGNLESHAIEESIQDSTVGGDEGAA